MAAVGVGGTPDMAGEDGVITRADGAAGGMDMTMMDGVVTAAGMVATTGAAADGRATVAMQKIVEAGSIVSVEMADSAEAVTDFTATVDSVAADMTVSAEAVTEASMVVGAAASMAAVVVDSTAAVMVVDTVNPPWIA
jgi:hypothetical protein